MSVFHSSMSLSERGSENNNNNIREREREREREGQIPLILDFIYNIDFPGTAESFNFSIVLSVVKGLVVVGTVLGIFQCLGVLLFWIIVGQGPTVLAVGAGSGCLDIFLLPMVFFFLSLRDNSI